MSVDAIFTGAAQGEPPYRAGVKSNGWRFEVDPAALAQSETWAIAAEIPLARHCALMSWLVSWGQVPAGSMPNSDLAFRALSGIPAALWPEVRAVVLRGWWLASDGRLYHPALIHRVKEMMARRRSDADRQAARRVKLAAADGESRVTAPGQVHQDAGAAPANVTRDLENVTRDTAVTTHGLTPESGTEYGVRSTEEKHREPSASFARVPAGASAHGCEGARGDGPPGDDPPPSDPPPPEDPDDSPPAEPPPPPSPYGAMCLLIRRRTGFLAVAPGNPKFRALVDAGVDAEVFCDAAQAAVKAGKGWAWVIGAVEGQLRDAAAIKPGQKVARRAPKSPMGHDLKTMEYGVTDDTPWPD